MNKFNLKKVIEEEISKIGLGWDIKGIIDSRKRIYTINNDTKLISKVLELIVTPIILDISRKHNIRVELSDRQTVYPDFTFFLPNNKKIALDIKSTYRKSNNRVAGFTLGSYTGYLRHPKKNIMYPYNEYIEHLIMGFIYTRELKSDAKIVSIGQIDEITPAIKDIEIVVHSKFALASDRPGSGNTANIGSSTEIDKLRKGQGIFSKYGESVFEDYWRNFLSLKIAKDMRVVQPYRNILGYFEWKKKR